ncbi:DUF2252 family protein, partial [Nocardia farcinica]|uniref:DUF2252 family protein n=1 Tax=Nocardia farcinica TaxID=37329 RepID=UPI0024539B17
MSDSRIDLRTFVPADEVRARGRALRERVPATARDRQAAGPRRPAVLDFLAAAHADRLAHLVPLRVGRMASGPFTFYRGAAGLMAADLADGPVTGVHAQLCGDAHPANFGLYGTSRGEIVMDINDFDETIRGPWEWDLERLAAGRVDGRPGCRVGGGESRGPPRDAARANPGGVDEVGRGAG